jgi:hypothetical protein
VESHGRREEDVIDDSIKVILPVALWVVFAGASGPPPAEVSHVTEMLWGPKSAFLSGSDTAFSAISRGPIVPPLRGGGGHESYCDPACKSSCGQFH